MAAQSMLEDLPLELLQYILERIEPTWLPNVRLTSKILCAAVHDVFAAEFLQYLSCHIFNPARLRRLENIATGRLGRKIQHLTLTADCFESFPPPIVGINFNELPAIAIAERKEDIHPGYDVSQFDLVRQYRKSSTSRYHYSVPWLAPLTSVLGKLKPARCSICVDLIHVPFDEVPTYAYLVHDLLDMIVSAGFPVHDLRLGDMDLDSPKRYNPTWASVLKDLQRFRIRDKSEEIMYDGEQLERLLRCMENLRTFEASFQPRSEQRRNTAATYVMTRVLLANNFVSLRTLRLAMLRVSSFESLRTVLGRCKETLHELYVYAVYVRSESENADQWEEVLRLIKTMPKLGDMVIWELSLAGSDVDLSVFVSEFEEDCEPEPLDIEGHGRLEIESALTDALTRGLVLVDEGFGDMDDDDDDDDDDDGDFVI